MTRRLMAAGMMLFIFPALANVWLFNTQARSAGGTITSRNKVSQSSSDGSLFRSYTTHAPLGVVVAANTGYSIGNVTVNGVVTLQPSSPFVTSVQGMNAQSVLATFTPTLLAVTASAGSGGTVSPSSVSNVYYGSKLTAPLLFSFRPAGGYHLNSLTGADGATVTPGVPAATNAMVTVSYPAGYTFSGPIALSGAFASTSPVAVAGAPQTVLENDQVTLTASYTGGTGTPPASYTWSQLSGPPVVLATSGSQASFTALSAGTYHFRVTLDNGSSASTTVIVSASLAAAARNQCQNCHTGTGIGSAQLFSNWSGSKHKEKQVICFTCHVGTNSGSHPGSLTDGKVNETSFNYVSSGANFCMSCHDPAIVSAYDASVHRAHSVTCASCHTNGVHAPDFSASACDACHRDASGEVAGHPLAIGATNCVSCHSPHTTAAFAGAPAVHYNNVTSAGYPASYMTSRAACSDCHSANSANAGIRRQWAGSGHAATTAPAWSAYDFKTRSGCVRCHTTTGFIAYSSGNLDQPWGVAADKTKELLSCVGCHLDTNSGALRTVTPAAPYPDDPYLSREAGKSNICISCHSGANNGKSISAKLAAGADFSNLAFIAPHYLAAAGVLHGSGGYHFPGPTYAFYSSNSHRGIGISAGNGSGGPCVACHKDSASDHSFSARSTQLCANCHGASLDAGELVLKRAAFANALSVLNSMLAAKGQPYGASYPYFSNVDWGADLAGANTMGAAFNYLLLLKEPGAYAHNPSYAKQLILDSIDYLYNGQVTGSIDSALSYLVAQERISQQAAQELANYQERGNCTSCHAQSSGSHPVHLNSGFGCADCHNGTVAGQTTLTPGNSSHLNGSTDLEAGPGRSFDYSFAASGGSCSSISCHQNGSATWGGTLGCDGCHGAPPATASHLKHYGGSVIQAGYGATGMAQDLSPDAGAYAMNCGNCHPLDKAKHGNGTVEVELYHAQAPAGSLKARNPASASYVAGETLFQDDRGIAYSKGTCSNIYCHSYKSWTTPTGVPPYPSSCTPAVPADLVTETKYKTVTWEGAPLGCAGCHANPPQTSYPGNGGAAGDSHAWLSDDFGWGTVEFLHNNNMYFETGNSQPLSCMYCHNDTVRQQSTFTRVETAASTYVSMNNVPINNFSKHVNGNNDVAFERQVTVPAISYMLGSNWTGQKLTNASYDAAGKTCSNVACHLLRTDVKWGTPYKGGVVNDCERCHSGYGGSCPDSAAAMSRQPSISSTGPLLAAPGYPYSYAVTASEPGGGALSYALLTAPEGMTISPSGVIGWTPREDQLGDAAVRIVVSSVASSGLLVAEQEFSIVVQPPQVNITSAPVTAGTAWKPYSYRVVAAAPGGMPALSYALTAYPSGMTINASTGSISWSPTDLQVGSHQVTVTATSAGFLATQSFSLQVSPPPVSITSNPVTAAQTQVPYSYPVSASMPGVTTFSYVLLVRPTGMAINGSTGVITWTPTASQAGSFPVTVQVTGAGYTARQSFTVVSTASPITITSVPVTTAKVGTAYSYAVTATMPGGGSFSYALPVRPTVAMTINSAGIVSWTPSASYLGNRSVTVSVTRGASTSSQSFTIAVSP